MNDPHHPPRYGGRRPAGPRFVARHLAFWFVATSTLNVVPSAHGRELRPESPPVPESAQEPVAESAPPKPLPGPKYLDLRYDEDFRYLEGAPGSYVPDFFDPLKNIKLDDDLRLTVGGEFRFRLEAETNLRFDANRRSQDTFQLYRYMLHFDLKYRDTARAFVQVATMHAEDRDLPDRPIDENFLALQQMFFDVRPLGDGTPLVARVGRQDLSYGVQRFVSPFDWGNIRRRFDAAKLFWKAKTWQLDVFYAKPVVVRDKQFDNYNSRFDFYGSYFTYQGIPRHGIDLFFFGIDDTGNRRNPNGRAGDVSRFTLGGRFDGKSSGFDYDTMLAGQWGRWAGDTIQAWAWTLDGGYTFESLKCQPRIGAGFDWASGDDNPRDGVVGTFDQLFPLGHKYFGFLDLVGRQNIQAVNVNVSAWAIPQKVQLATAYHTFWLASREDALYNAAGAATRRDPVGNSGREVGHELDVTLLWKIDRHSTLLFGYSHFWDSDLIINTGKSEDPDLLYMQYSFKF